MIFMEFEVHYTRKIEADNFFEAVDQAKESIENIEEIIAVNPWIEDLEDDLMI